MSQENPNFNQRPEPETQLAPGEELIRVETITPHLPERHLSALKAVMGLTAAPTPEEIGFHGPSNAANVTEANKDISELNLYGVFFPRDAHVVARFLASKYPALARATIDESLRFTGVRENLRGPGLKDEQELWKVPHEIRDGDKDPIARRLTEENDWGWPYYGAIDTTPKNVNAITTLALDPNNEEGGLAILNETYKGLDGRTHSIGEALQGHINWIRKRMELNPEGLVESLALNPKSNANQTWADSPDSFFHADGTMAQHHPEKNWGAASVELQGEVYDALVSTAELYKKQSAAAKGTRKQFFESEIQDLTARAEKLRKVVLDKFWVDDPDHFGGYFARGTDRDDQGNLRPLAIRTSDMGHLLNSRILDGDDPEDIRKREAVIKNLFSPEMLSPSGIRTLSTDSIRYNDERYHGGTSWPWVTYHIALGLQRHGYYGLSYELKKRAWSVYDATKILPELASGSSDPSKRLITRKIIVHDSNTPQDPERSIGQPPQEIQAWTAAAILAMKYEEGERINSQLRPNRRTGTEIPTAALDSTKLQFENQILSKLHR